MTVSRKLYTPAGALYHDFKNLEETLGQDWLSWLNVVLNRENTSYYYKWTNPNNKSSPQLNDLALIIAEVSKTTRREPVILQFLNQLARKAQGEQPACLDILSAAAVMATHAANVTAFFATKNACQEKDKKECFGTLDSIIRTARDIQECIME